LCTCQAVSIEANDIHDIARVDSDVQKGSLLKVETQVGTFPEEPALRTAFRFEMTRLLDFLNNSKDLFFAFLGYNIIDGKWTE
ncbi:hypothetical protein, partial [Escherichia coli]|uniref:hypothetical protein n=1 Tax=Escherichia coli TaxID=562 RepID=UPI00289C6122